ncbi:MAG: hypothetical protein WDN67_00710 [Candidatus Moraniibacteriota bacterium]
MISTSQDANPNYLAKIVELKALRKHDNADRLQVATVDFQDVITGQDAKIGDLYVFFPLECQINYEFLKETDSFSSQLLNKDTTVKGYFDKNGRVRAVKLRGQKSMGYLAPLSTVEAFVGESLIDYVGCEFDTVGKILLCKKYVIQAREPRALRMGQKPRISRLVEGQVRLHVDTEQLRRNAFLIKPEDHISISYKTHGTSFWVAHVLVKKKLNIFLKFLRKLLPIQETEYDYVYGSRRVVKNEFETAQKAHFYNYDLWEEAKNELREFLPKGYTIYGEILGYTKDGAPIQVGYDYGCTQGTKRIQVYRITVTNADGNVLDLSSHQIKEFCERFGLEYVHLFFSGKPRICSLRLIPKITGMRNL